MGSAVLFGGSNVDVTINAYSFTLKRTKQAGIEAWWQTDIEQNQWFRIAMSLAGGPTNQETGEGGAPNCNLQILNEGIGSSTAGIPLAYMTVLNLTPEPSVNIPVANFGTLHI